MTRSDIEATVLSILSLALKTEVDASASRLNLPTWDSLKHIEIIFAIEDALNVQFDEEELARLNSVVSIVDAGIARHAA